MISPVHTETGIRERPDLPDFDVRHHLDLAVRRGWADVGRRALRRAVLVSADLAAAGLAVFLAVALVNELWISGGIPIRFGWSLAAFILSVQPLALGAFGVYGGGALRIDFGRIVAAVFTAAILSLVFSWLAGMPQPMLGAGGAALYAASAIGLIFAARLGVDAMVSFAYSRGIGQKRVLVVGTAAETRRVMELLEGQRGSDMKVVGTLSPTGKPEPGAVGTAADLEEQLGANRARGVIIASSLSSEALETLIRKCFEYGAAASVLPGTLHRFRRRLDLRQVRSGVFFEIQPEGLRLPKLATKRAMDIALCVLLLLVTWPLYLVIALLIKLDSPGPILFKQRRAGVGGQPFRMYKFRTMVADADRLKAQLQHLNGSGDPRLFKIKADPRVTRIGRFLRRTSLDELPQVFNVLRGEMSLVGPRPFFPEDLDTYQPHHFERLHVLPGITGLWQVSGRSDIVDFEEVVRLDAEYIRNWSVGRDLVILAKTIPAALGRGAY